MTSYTMTAALIGSMAFTAVLASQRAEQHAKSTDAMSTRVTIKVGNRSFPATLADNATAAALRELLPLSITMQELNGNEKLFRLPRALPTQEYRPPSIKTGDVMLYGSNTLVLFYKSFPTSYSYSKIGRVDDPAGLGAALGAGDVVVVFEAAAAKP